jgi:uncharacterized protein YjeT (DUF2065 family)
MASGQPANPSPPQNEKPVPGPGHRVLRLCSVKLPAKLRLVAPRLADALADGIWLAVWPFGGGIVLGALTTGFLFPLLWPGMHVIYSESLLFLLLVVAAAFLNGCIAVMLLFGYAAGDIVHIGLGNLFSASNPLPTLAGHLVGYSVLGIVAVVLPAMARSMARQLASKTANSQLSTLAEAGLFGLAAGVLTYAWCQGAVVLLRPIFTWAGESPISEAIVHVQQDWPGLVAVAVVVASAKPFLEQLAQRSPSRVLISQWKREVRASASQRRRIPAPVRLLFTSLIATFVLAGTYASWLDALLVFATTLGLGAWRSGLIGHFPAAWTQPISRIPVLLRFMAGLIVGYILSGVVLSGAWHQTDSLRPIMLGALLTLAALYVLLPKPRPNGGPGKPGGFKWSSPSGVLFLFILVIPTVALADNCSSLSDCWPTAGAAAGAAAGAGAAAAASAGNDSDPCQSERNAVDDAQDQVDGAQVEVDGLQREFDAFAADLPRSMMEAYTQGQAAMPEWLQYPDLYAQMDPLEQELMRIGGGDFAAPGTPGAPSTEAVLDGLNFYFSVFGTRMAMGGGVNYPGVVDPQSNTPALTPITQLFLQSLLKLKMTAGQVTMFQQQLTDAKKKLADAQEQLQNAQQALSNCMSGSAVGE